MSECCVRISSKEPNYIPMLLVRINKKKRRCATLKFPKYHIESIFVLVFTFSFHPKSMQISNIWSKSFISHLLSHSVVCSVAWIIGYIFFLLPFLRACTWAKDNFSSFIFLFSLLKIPCTFYRYRFSRIFKKEYHYLKENRHLLEKNIEANALENVRTWTRTKPKKEPKHKHK